MAKRVTFKHYLRYWDPTVPDWQYYYVTSGIVDFTLGATELGRAPEGWQEYEVGWERGFTYYGLFTAYTTPLKFHKDGALILRYLAYTFGIEAKCELFVEKLNTSDYTYSTFFRGDIDFSQMQDEFDFVVVPIMENGFAAKLKARENTPYEFGIDGNPDVQYVYHDGIDLQARLSWSGLESDNFDFYPNIYFDDTEGTNVSIHAYPQAPIPGQITILENTSGSSVDLNLKCDFNFDVTTGVGTSNANAQLIFVLYSLSTGIISDNYILNSSFTHGASTSHNYSGTNSQTITVADNQGIYVGFRLLIIGGGGVVVPSGDYSTYLNSIEISAYFINKYKATFVPCLYVSDVFRYLMQQIGADNLEVPDPDLTITSTLLDTTWMNEIVITSGDGLRGLQGSKLRITFADFFKFINTKFGCAFYYNKVTNTVYLEAKSEVFKAAPSSTYPLVKKCSNFKATPFTQEAFVNLKIGCGTYSYDKRGASDQEITNGKDECNNTHEYLSPLVRVGKTADYVSTVRDDRYGIEEIRVNLSGKELADSSNDNDVFAMHVEADNSSTFTFYVGGSLVTINYHLLYRAPIVPGTWEIKNIFSPETAYNILLTPTRSVFRNGDYFRALLKLNDPDFINFRLSGKNAADNVKMYTMTGGVIDFNEGGAIQISSLCDDGRELFQPILFEFETREDINLYNLIESDPYKYIGITWLGNTYYGFIISIKSKPALRGTTQFKLLATNYSLGTDLSKLIR